LEIFILVSAGSVKAILPLILAIKAAAFGAKKHSLKKAAHELAKRKVKKVSRKKRRDKKRDEEE
jgi:hypothetical protein